MNRKTTIKKKGPASDAARQLRWAQRLHAFALRLSAADTSDDIAAAVLKEARDAFHSDRATISRVGDDGDPMHDVVTGGRPRFFESRAALVGRYPQAFITALERDKVQALAILPVRHARDVFGVLTLAWRKGRKFPADERKLMTTFAAQAAPAFDRALRHEALHRKRDATITDTQRASQVKSLLIDDLLIFARLGAGRVVYDIQAVSVRDAVYAALEFVEPQMEAAGLTCSTSVDEMFVVAADRDKLQVILLNLLSNSIKFTDRGGRISLDVPVRPALPDDAIFLRVADTGCGIPRTKQEQIFEPFVQAHRHLPRSASGSGLGLAIARDLARGMGGDLRVRSEEGKGSSFTLTLKRHPESEL